MINKRLTDFINGLKVGVKYPENYQLNLCEMLTDEEIKTLATALSEGQCPRGLQINFYSAGITDAGIQALAAALLSGNCPENLGLILSGNKITDAGACFLAQALSSGKCPAGLVLSLWGNQITDAGGEALIAALLLSGRCPRGLKIDLANNPMNEAAVVAYMNYCKQRRTLAACLTTVSFVMFCETNKHMFRDEEKKLIAPILAKFHLIAGTNKSHEDSVSAVADPEIESSMELVD